MLPYRIAHLSPDQMAGMQDLERDMGVALVAYEPVSEAEQGATSSMAEESLVLDGLLDTYRTFDPHLIV